jgi:uncharacterized membrane protein
MTPCQPDVSPERPCPCPCPNYTRAAVLSRRTHLALTLVAVLHAATTLTLAFLRYANVHQRTFDLALYARAAWGLAHGDGWLPILNTHVLAAHVAPVLAPLGLLGRVFGTVPVLLVAQSVTCALCVWPIARIGARRMGTRGVWLAVTAFCLYPNLGHVATYEFHPGTLAVLPLCWAYDALDRARFSALVWSCVAVVFCRDDFGLACVLFALLYALEHRDRRAKWLAVAAFVYTALAVGISARYAPENSSAMQHFGIWGGSPLGVFKMLVTDPGTVWAHFTAQERLLYLPRLLAPLSFFALRAPRLLLPALPYLALNLISTFPTSLQQYSHYLTPAVPGLVVAGVVGVTVVKKRGLHVLWFVTLGLSSFALGGLPWSRDFDRGAFVEDEATRAARRVLAAIPDAASVQAPDALLPHLVERREVRRAASPESGARFTVLDVSHRQRFAHTETLLRTSEEPGVRSRLARSDYGLLVYAPPYALLERGRDPRSAPAVAELFVHDARPDQRLTACLGVVSARLDARTLELVLRAHAPCAPDLALRFGPAPSPWHVDLLGDGALSPAQLRVGDVVRSRHGLSPRQAAELAQKGIWVGALRASGAPPEPGDPVAVRVTE